MSDPYDLRHDQVISEYHLVRKLGEGGFGTVYLTEHIREHSPVALKMYRVPLANTEDFDSFVNEARIMMRLEHPHIIPFFDFGLSRDHRPFLVMEYIPEGMTIRHRHPKGSKLLLPAVAEYVEQIASALQFTHEQNIVHRDVKPENILLRADGTLLLSDFGIAKIIDSTLTTKREQPGTPDYMAPEQLKGDDSFAKFASDQYALAIIAYEWISGTCPFQGDRYSVAFQKVTLPLPPPLRDRLPTLPLAVEEVIFKALSKEPTDRFKTVEEFAVALRSVVQEQATIPPYETEKSHWTPPPKKPPVVPEATERAFALTSNAIPPNAPYSPPPPPPSPQKTKRSWPLSRTLFLLGGVFALLVGGGVFALLPGVPVFRPVLNTSHAPALDKNSVSNLVKKWAFQTGGFVHSSPEVVNGTVYIGSGDDNVYAIDALSGKQKWAFQTGDKVTSWPVVVNGVVYVGSDDNDVYAIDALSGQKKWVFQTGDQVTSSPAVVNGVVYIGSADDNVYAIDVLSGQKKWAFQTGDQVKSSPAVVDGVVYIGSVDSNVYAIDALSGLQKWAFQTGGRVYSSPAVVDRVVYVGSDDNNIYAIDAQSGLQKWAFQTGGAVESSPSVADGLVFIGSLDHNVYAIDALSGQKKWTYQTGGAVDSSPSVVDGLVFIGSDDHDVYAIDALSGQEKWGFQTGDYVASSPAIANDFVYVGSYDGYVYAFGL